MFYILVRLMSRTSCWNQHEEQLSKNTALRVMSVISNYLVILANILICQFNDSLRISLFQNFTFGVFVFVIKIIPRDEPGTFLVVHFRLVEKFPHRIVNLRSGLPCALERCYTSRRIIEWCQLIARAVFSQLT